ncbi:CRAL/TRIO domain-containing protein [Auricularia subglabra TFB-10046 SS5]|nr:CRAL/TRIO domain-containing protein [Auricularia subglabra TFB-10046 SS5]
MSAVLPAPTPTATTEPKPGSSSSAAAQKAPPPAAANAGAADPLSGHVGHLDAAQTAVLAAFKSALKEQGLYADVPAPTHDDGTLLRFLRARRFVVADAVAQFADTAAWRAQNRMDALYEHIDVADYEETRRLYPQWTGRRDRRGIPVYVFKVAALDSKTMAAYTKSSQRTSISISSAGDLDGPPTPTSSGFSHNTHSGFNHHHSKHPGQHTPARMLRLFALYENLTRFVMPLCTAARDRPNTETPITQSSNIVDISGVGLRQFWNLRSHMQDASQLATAHYPETLDRIFIIGAPSFFPTVWGWIKKWFDPITTSKIFILPSDPKEVFATLSQYIDTANIPTQYGGTLEYAFGEMPKLDAHLASLIEWDAAGAGTRANGEHTLPIGPVVWDHSTGEAFGVGSVEGKDRRVRMAVLKEPFGAENVEEKVEVMEEKDGSLDEMAKV